MYHPSSAAVALPYGQQLQTVAGLDFTVTGRHILNSLIIIKCSPPQFYLCWVFALTISGFCFNLYDAFNTMMSWVFYGSFTSHTHWYSRSIICLPNTHTHIHTHKQHAPNPYGNKSVEPFYLVEMANAVIIVTFNYNASLQHLTLSHLQYNKRTFAFSSSYFKQQSFLQSEKNLNTINDNTCPPISNCNNKNTQIFEIFLNKRIEIKKGN